MIKLRFYLQFPGKSYTRGAIIIALRLLPEEDYSPPLPGRKSCPRLKSLSPGLLMSTPFLCRDLKAVTVSCEAWPNCFPRATRATFARICYTWTIKSPSSVLCHCMPHPTPLSKNKVPTLVLVFSPPPPEAETGSWFSKDYHLLHARTSPASFVLSNVRAPFPLAVMTSQLISY